VGGGVVGAVLESFVAMELLRQAEWTERPLQLFHYATIARSEITREPETPEGGRCVGAQPRSGGALGLDGSDAQVGQVAEQRSGIPPFAVGGRR